MVIFGVDTLFCCVSDKVNLEEVELLKIIRSNRIVERYKPCLVLAYALIADRLRIDGSGFANITCRGICGTITQLLNIHDFELLLHGAQ